MTGEVSVHRTFAQINVGSNISGKLAVEIKGSEDWLQANGLKKQFERAAAAFMREFAATEKLVASSHTGPDAPLLTEVTEELQARRGTDAAIKA